MDRGSVSLSFLMLLSSVNNKLPLSVSLSKKSNTMNAEEAPLSLLPPPRPSFVAEKIFCLAPFSLIVSYYVYTLSSFFAGEKKRKVETFVLLCLLVIPPPLCLDSRGNHVARRPPGAQKSFPWIKQQLTPPLLFFYGSRESGGGHDAAEISRYTIFAETGISCCYNGQTAAGRRSGW